MFLYLYEFIKADINPLNINFIFIQKKFSEHFITSNDNNVINNLKH